MKKRLTSKEQLIDLLLELHPDLVFEPQHVRRNHEQNRFNEQPYWTAMGKRYRSILKYDSVHFYGRATMKDCVKEGITTSLDHSHYEVDLK